MIRSLAVVCVVGLLCGTVSLAGAEPVSQPSRPDTLLYMNPFEILVTAPRVRLPLKQVPAATTVVGKEQLEAMPRGVSIDEALRTVPGVRIDDQMDAERIHLSIRGQGILTEAGVRGTKVLLDGLPLNDPSGVAPDLYDIDWSIVDRVEVLRGPAGALYGGGGSGGVINVTTNDGPSGSLHGGVATTFGSYGFNKTTTTAGGTREHANYTVSVSRAQSDGWRQRTAFSARNVYEKVHWNPTNRVSLTQVVGWTDYFDQNAEGLNWAQVSEDPRQPNPDSAVYDEYYRTHRFFSGITGRALASAQHDFQFSGYFRMTQFAVSVPSNVAHRNYYTPGLSAQYNNHYGIGRLGDAAVVNHFSAGSDVQWQGFNEYKLSHPQDSRAEDVLQSNEHVSQQGTGVFLIDRLAIGKRWTVTLGGRYDRMSNSLRDLFYADLQSDSTNASGSADFHKTTARAGVAFTAMKGLNVYADWAQGFLPPSTEELSNNPDAFGGFNRHLEPATSQGEEVGARGTLGDYLAYDVTGFRLTTDDDFDRYRIESRPHETFYVNVGPSRRYGIETQVRVHPVRYASAEVAYTYSHFRYSKGAYLAGVPLDGKLLPNCPAHQLGVDLECSPVQKLTLGVTCDVQTEWQINSENTDGGTDSDGNPFYAPPVNGFTLWGARASYAWHLGGVAGELTIAARNLFDRKYIAFSEPDPDGNSYQPGPGRTVFGGVRVGI